MALLLPSVPKLRVDEGDEPSMVLAAALETATRLSSSVARRLELGLVMTPLQALDVVMDGSVAQARRRRGRRLLLLLRAPCGLGDESLRGR